MINYSRMSYEELRKIADDDSNSARLSDEEYEALSVELWRKFGAEKALSEQNPPAETITDPGVACSSTSSARTLGENLIHVSHPSV